jgi:hypothetical protein
MRNWLPNMDLNHDKQIQSLLCYRYTIRQSEQRKNIGFDSGVKPTDPKRDATLSPAAGRGHSIHRYA